MQGAPPWLLESLRSDPIRMVDVGARGGWQRKWRDHEDVVSFVGVEPDVEECARLRAGAKPNEQFIDRALYHSVGEVTLYLTDPPARTSIYEPDLAAMRRIFNADSTKIARRIPVKVTTFDLAMAPLSLGPIDCVKLDTQGSELDILRGAEAALADAMIALEIEVEFTPIYHGQPTYPDVTTFLRTKGFEFIDFATTASTSHIRFGNRGLQGYGGMGDLVANWASLVRPRGGLRGGQRMIYADAIYFREPDQWMTAVTKHGDRARSLGLRGFMTICILGYDDQADEVARRLHDAALISSRELSEAHAYVDYRAATWRRAGADLARFGRRVAHRLQHLGTGR